jgi:hypothetical protein
MLLIAVYWDRQTIGIAEEMCSQLVKRAHLAPSAVQIEFLINSFVTASAFFLNEI